MRNYKKNVLVVTSFSVFAVLCITSGPALHAGALQTQKAATPSLGSPIGPDPALELGNGSEAHMRRIQEGQAMDERHKKMQSDADQLLQLATDLKAEVDRSGKNETSVSAFRKADQIEKLAHDVKQRLKN